jgi:DNA mismatch repair protein PMS2
VSPDKRTILLHSENNLIESLKVRLGSSPPAFRQPHRNFQVALTEEFDNARSSFVLNATQVALAQKETEQPLTDEGGSASNAEQPLFIPDDDDVTGAEQVGDIATGEPNSEVAPTDDSSGLPMEEETENASPPSEDPRPVEKRPRSASPDPVADDETRPLKKIDAARSPSPALASAPAPSTAVSQRLAGPGRTPVRVEQILSTDTSGTGRGVQMVLNTSGASWNLKLGHEGPSRKRPHMADVSGSNSGKNARINMRARLAGFARDGPRVVQDKEDEDSPEEEEGVEDEDACTKRKKVDDADDDDEEYEASGKASSSTDLVDETMAVDPPDSEDEAPKSKPKSKGKGRALTSPTATKRADDAEPMSSEELFLPDDSSSTSAPPSNIAAATASSSHDAVSGVRTEVVRTVVGASPPLAFDLERTTNTWSAYLERSAASASAPQPAPRSSASELGHADLAADNEHATAALARVLSKADFGSMRVVGQFNRGFIVARLSAAANDDLFIVDQHAADEKYNFETLQTTTRLESQRLFTCVRFLYYYSRPSC